MSSVKINVVANVAANLWASLLGLVLVPTYFRYIGREGYGLIGFFAMTASVVGILDGGLGAAAVREVARWSKHAAGNDSLRELVRVVN